MERFCYVKTYLYAYPKLEALADAVAGGAEVKALLSFRDGGDALSLALKIAEEIATAKKLVLLKCELDELVSRCSDEEKFLLEYKYFRRKSELKAYGTEPLKCSERSYFRMQNALLSKMSALLVSKGRTEKEFFREFGSFAPFLRVYRAIQSGRERAVSFKRRKRGVSFRQNSENSCTAGAGFLPRSTTTATTTSAAAARHRTTICNAEMPAASDAGPSVPPPEVSFR